MKTLFLAWPILKEENGDAILVFTFGDTCYLANDDALEASQRLALGDEIIHTKEGIYWSFNAAYKGMLLREIEAAGLTVVYVTDRMMAGIREVPEEIRATTIDEGSGRVYLGKSSLGSYWYDRTRKTVYMRWPNGQWLGEYCLASDWPLAEKFVQGYVKIPV